MRRLSISGIAFVVALGLIVALAASVAAQDVDFTSSDLPILIIDTEGMVIPDEPKIMATLGVIDNGPGVRNALTDPSNGYDGLIGIETRGSSSQGFPKKSFGFETRQADSTNRNVSLLGLPEENDWVLYAPYSDKSLLRNVVAYALARRTGRYASRTRFCEVVVNGVYEGVYVLMESIKRDRNRVDIATLNPDETEGDDLTGGYIVKVDRQEGGSVGGWDSEHLSNGAVIHYEYHYPKPDDLVPAQAAYIKSVIDAFEDAMVSDEFEDLSVGYPGFFDVGSLVDYFLVQELAKNVDAYRLSTFLHKDKNSNGGELVIGPVWDLNIGFGSANYYGGAEPTGFFVHSPLDTDPIQIPFWWPRLTESAAFVGAVQERWAVLREGPFHPDALDALIDEQAALLEEAQARNFQRWPVLGVYIWPNAFVGTTYAEEIEYLKSWTRERAAWLDENMVTLGTGVDAEPPSPDASGTRLAAYPSPAAGPVRLDLDLTDGQPVRIAVYDVLGRRVDVLHDGPLSAGDHRFTWRPRSLPSGVYFVQVRGEQFASRQRVVLL